MNMPSSCRCHEIGINASNQGEEQHLGVDETAGRFADVTLQRCAICGTLWLHYRVEYEGFSGSGRWGMAQIDEATAAIMTPEAAADYIDRRAWCVIGGSFWDSAGKRLKGPLRWG